MENGVSWDIQERTVSPPRMHIYSGTLRERSLLPFTQNWPQLRSWASWTWQNLRREFGGKFQNDPFSSRQTLCMFSDMANALIIKFQREGKKYLNEVVIKSVSETEHDLRYNKLFLRWLLKFLSLVTDRKELGDYSYVLAIRDWHSLPLLRSH